MHNTLKLLIPLTLDMIGIVSYMFPFFGELSDIIYAPLYGWWIYYAYNSKKGALFGAIEELLPYTDIIPTATIVHFRRKEL